MVFFIFTSISFAQEDAEYNGALKTMFEFSGTEGSYTAAIKQIFVKYKNKYPNVDATVWSELESVFLKTSLDDLVTMLAPVYNKYMTKEDIKLV